MNIKLRDSVFYMLINGVAFCMTGWLLFFFDTGMDISPTNLGMIILFTSGIIDAYLIEGALDIYRFSRMKIIENWFFRSLIIWAVILFFSSNPTLGIDRLIAQWIILFLVPATFKIVALSWSSRRLRSQQVSYRTLLIGSGEKAQAVFDELHSKILSLGQNFVGSVGQGKVSGLPLIGPVDQVESIISDLGIEEVIVAIEKDQYLGLDTILNTLRSFPKTLLIRITPDSYDFLMGHIKMDALHGVALMELPAGRLMIWQTWIKRIADFILSFILLFLLLPLILYIAIRTAWSSTGPVIYHQTRIGRYGQPFKIYKFRSMRVDSESQGPSLSFDGDPRCTPWGNFMRKWRLDEIPQFINVIKGDMSIVGPRPERKFFIDQIKLEAPYYSRILTVRPGITSWGQVKYGYASDVKQMIERLKFDLIYVENQSLTLDIKIICYTILVLFQGKGK